MKKKGQKKTFALPKCKLDLLSLFSLNKNLDLAVLLGFERAQILFGGKVSQHLKQVEGSLRF